MTENVKLGVVPEIEVTARTCRSSPGKHFRSDPAAVLAAKDPTDRYVSDASFRVSVATVLHGVVPLTALTLRVSRSVPPGQSTAAPLVLAVCVVLAWTAKSSVVVWCPYGECMFVLLLQAASPATENVKLGVVPPIVQRTRLNRSARKLLSS